MDFDEKASVYEKISTSQKQAAEHLASLLTFINEGDKILDVGCGTGYFTDLIYKKSNNVEGIDISNNMINTASKIRPHIKFKVADGEDYKTEEKFSLITTNAVTYYFKNLIGTFRKFHHLLEKNGVYALQAQTIVTPQFSKAIDGLTLNPETKSIFSGFKMPTHQLERSEYETLIKKAGFEIFFSEEIKYSTETTTNGAMDIFRSGTATPLLNQEAYSKKLTDKYINEFWSTIKYGLEIQTSETGHITLEIPRVYILARKK